MEGKSDLYGICPYATAQRLLAGKWTLLIFHYLSKRTMRFNELMRELPDLTQTTLTKQLRILEDNDLIHRRVYQQIPPKVEYSLSKLGREFEPVLQSIEEWGYKYIDFLKEGKEEK